jgi:hypothetical protein
MALNQSLLQMRNGVRKLANIQGTTALARHPDADLNDYICRALGSVHRRLTVALPDQRFLASTTITTVSGQTTYSLPGDFDYLISIELTADGSRRWLQAYEMAERPYLISPDVPNTGVPLVYRLRGANIELLPSPDSNYAPLVWYVPTAPQLAADVTTWDTISRLDEYVIAYAARKVATKDKNWDLVAECKAVMAELEPEIDMLGRNRDRNSPPRIIDTYSRDRWGRAYSGRSR